MTINLGKVGFYLIGALAVIYNFLVLVIHPAWLDASMGTIATIDTVLGFLGVGSFRVSIGEAWKGVDLGPVGPWIQGKKAYLSVVLSAIFTIVAAFWGVSPATPWVIFVNAVLQIFGLSFGVAAQNRMMKKAKMNNSRFASAFTKVGIVAALMLLFAGTLQAQTWEDFWHKRPAINQVKTAPDGRMLLSPNGVQMLAPVTATRYEFKPSITVIATSFSPANVSGAPWVTDVVNGAGPGLCLANTTQNDDGLGNVSNYVNYSVTASLILGSGNQSPVIGSSGALMVGFLNNLLSVGAKYDFYAPDNRKPWGLLVGTQIMFTLN